MKIRMRKRLSAPGLLEAVRTRFNRIVDPLQGQTDYPLDEVLMSALAMFSLKFPSLLQFDNSRVDKWTAHNLKTLYGVEQVPSDTYMRERLDEVLPKRLQRAFKSCLSAVQNGKLLRRYYFLDDYVLVSNDGTGLFYSDSVHCENCCVKHHRDGKTSYYHQMMCSVIVHPDEPVVLPLWMEPILKNDGTSKNDCERNASKRLLTDLRHMHPQLKMMVVEDSLHSNAPHIGLLKSLNYAYIVEVKPKDHKWLFDWVNVSRCKTYQMERAGYRLKFRWQNDMPLNEANEQVRVNFFECEEISPKGKVQHFSWVTSEWVTEGNVYALMKGARARWRIENETFNTLKTQGYHFEHNYGHGYHYLSTILGMLMMLAFLIDQVQQLCCPQFQKALARCRRKK